MKKEKNNQSIPEMADRLVRHYRLPYGSCKEEVLGTILEKIERQERRKVPAAPEIRWTRMAGVAAAAVFILLVAFYFFTASVTFSAGKEALFVTMLPDASRVVLQEGSELQYRKYFWNGSVRLRGEAYFEVTRGEGFQVKTPGGKVRVLGTRFSVVDLGEQLKVQCFEGRVKTEYNEESWILEAGSRLVGEGKIVRKEKMETPTGYPAFALFSESFSDESLESVVKELEAFFGAEIKIRDGAGKNFTGSFQTGNLDNALKIICTSLKLQYKFTANNQAIIFE